MNICKIETIELNTQEELWFNTVYEMCENIIKEANNPEIIGSAELVIDGLNVLLSHVITKD